MKYLSIVLVMIFLSGCDCPKPKWDYSEGTRIGTVSKLSYKKVLDTADDVPKSWEGIAITDDNPSWAFSVDTENKTVRDALQNAIETHARVILHYTQCQGGCSEINKRHVTDYLVDKVTIAGAR